MNRLTAHRKLKWFDSPRILPWVVLCMGLLITALTWHATRYDTRNQLRDEFNAHVSQISNRIEKRHHESLMILRGISGLFNASNEVTRDEFHTYIDSLQVAKHYPGIGSIGLSVLVPAGSKEEFIRKTRRQGLPEYEIWPTGERELYAPVFFRETMTGSGQRAIGFDLFSEAFRREAMLLARDSGNIAMTGKLLLASDVGQETRTAFLMYSPVYRNGSPHETVDDRRNSIVGWAYLSFRVSSMMDGIFGESLHNIGRQVGFHLYDGAPLSDDAILYHSHGTDPDDTIARKPLFEASAELSLANRKWTLVVHTKPEFEARLFDSRQMFVIGIGCLVSLLLSFIVWQQVNRRARAISLARKMNYDVIDREKRYRQMFEDNASIAYILDPESGKLIDINTAAAQFWGYTLDELREMNIADINVSPLDELQTGMQQQVKEGSPGQFHFRHKLKNGEIREVEIYRSMLTHQGNTYIYCIVHDATSRIRAEKALRESQEKLRAIIDTAMDSVAQFDLNGIIIDWNLMAEKTFGWPRAEAIGKPLLDTIIPPHLRDEYRDSARQFLESDDSPIRHSRFEIVGLHRDGHELPIEMAITTMIGNAGQPEFCAFIHDITNRKRNENALRKARNELENRVFERTAELVRANRRLNSEIAERTQTQEALMQSQNMLRELVAHQDRIRETERKRIAREIHDELGQHLLVLRIDVSMLSRDTNTPEQAKLKQRIDSILQHIDTTMKSVRAIINNLRPSVLDLGLFAALEWQAQEFQRRSGIECTLQAEEENLELDDNTSTVLFRILQEALNNVLKHARASRVQIDLRRHDGRLVLKVTDNGVGITQTQNKEQKSFGLTGIRERISVLGGTLEIDSSGNGTVLVVSLPLEEELAA
ncbi:MAG: domain S-box [Burkholderiaceae bacterium]|nr:domain S-box [Burkholderiaceae bacterium]